MKRISEIILLLMLCCTTVYAQTDSLLHPVKGYWAVMLHGNLGIGEAYSVRMQDEALSCKTSGNMYGVDFGYIVPARNSMLGIGFFTGLSYVPYKMSFDYSAADYTIQSGADVDGDSYIRHYKNLRLSQRVRNVDLCVPLYADFDVAVSRSVSIYADLGMIFNFGSSQRIEECQGEAYVYGVYPQYSNLLMDENWGYNGFGNTVFNAENVESMTLSSFSTDIFLGAGVRYTIPDTPVRISAGIIYQNGSSDTFGRTGNGQARDMVYNTISDMTSTEHVSNLVCAARSIRHNAMRVRLGVAYYF